MTFTSGNNERGLKRRFRFRALRKGDLSRMVGEALIEYLNKEILR